MSKQLLVSCDFCQQEMGKEDGEPTQNNGIDYLVCPSCAEGLANRGTSYDDVDPMSQNF